MFLSRVFDAKACLSRKNQLQHVARRVCRMPRGSLVRMTDPLFLFDSNSDDTPLNCDEVHTGWKITLPQGMRRHALQAMRLKTGDTLQLSDGQGLRIYAAIDDANAGLVEVLSVGKEPKPVTRLALIQALAKTGHDEQAIDMATQLGVDTVIPWQAHRSIAKWKQGRTDRKWHNVLAGALEQSRRAWLPELGELADDDDVIAICRRASVHGDLVIVLHQDATATWTQIRESMDRLGDASLEDGKARTVYVIVGPEGGIAEDEVGSFVDAGAVSCVLGHNILRASLAGPAAISLLSEMLGRFA